MSKITIFLCAALFAAAVDATYLSNALASAQQTVEALVAAEIAKVEQKYEQAKKRADDLAEKLETAANEFSDKVAGDIKKIEDKIEADVKKVVDGTKVDVSECEKMIDHLRETGQVVVSNMTACIVDKKEAGLAYIGNMNMAAANVLGNLSSIRDESHRCAESVEGIGSAISAIACTKMAGVKATWVAAKSVPALTINMGKMTYLLSTLKPSLAYCTTTHGLARFYRESATIVRKTKICAQQKVDEARRSSTTTKATVTEKTEATEPTVPEVEAETEPAVVTEPKVAAETTTEEAEA